MEASFRHARRALRKQTYIHQAGTDIRARHGKRLMGTSNPSGLQSGTQPAKHNDTEKPNPWPFYILHLSAFAAIFTGVKVSDLWLALGLYLLRMFGVTAGYHRYFAHKTFKTSRVFQFILAFIAQTSAQRGVLWWAAHHRAHHRHSDTDLDLHSPARKGFWHAHFGWVIEPKNHATNYDGIQDFARYPELVWLERNPFLPPVVLGVVVFAFAGWSGLVVGYVWSLIACYHATFCINSLAHVHGRQRFVTGDHSRNNWGLAIATMGEGWHNNHHAFPNSARQGFKWWEFDLTFAILRLLSLVGIVRELRHPPKELVQGIQIPGPALMERAAHQLLQDFADRLAQARQTWRMPSGEELQALAARTLPKNPHLDGITRRAQELSAHWKPLWADMERAAQHVLEDFADRLALARENWRMPSVEELRTLAQHHMPKAPDLDQIVARANQLAASWTPQWATGKA
jgi:stearoyl-CoA desaturase (Delta-9 desaturase)